MRLTRVEVTGLFDRFDYVIPLNREERVTILHGPNGFGKTTLLQLIGNALRGRFEAVIRSPFKTLSLHLDENSPLVLSRIPRVLEEGASEQEGELRSFSLVAKLGTEEGTIHAISDEVRERILRTVDRLPGIERVAFDAWIEVSSGKRVALEEILLSRAEALPSHIRHLMSRGENKVVRQIRDLLTRIKVSVIDTQRLIATRDLEVSDESSRMYAQRSRREPTSSPAVVAYAQMLGGEIREHLRQYGVKASSLDRSLPARLLAGTPEDIEDGELRKRYEAVVTSRQNLVKAGVLQEPQGVDVDFPHQLERSTKQVLRMYLDDMEQKLSVFDGFAERVQLFTQLIGGLFKHKRIDVGPENGFQFVTDEGHTISPEKLSSGEQHQLILLFDLLFRVDEHSLILVDEPEISLHVEWQQKVLNNFREISKLRDLDFLIATHSADIILDRWDLTVGLAQGGK